MAGGFPAFLEELAERGLLDRVIATCRAHGVHLEEVHGRTRRAQYTAARVAIWAWLREMGWSLEEVGRLFGRDHSTVRDGLAYASRRRSS